MSTACVSAFYDVVDVIAQNRNKNFSSQQRLQSSSDRKAVGTPITGGHHIMNRSRNPSVGSSSTSSSCGLSSPDRYSPTLLTTNNLVNNVHGSPVFGSRDGLSNLPHRKLDRSVSEPVGDRNSNTQQQRNNGANINSSRYKTELCRPYEESGYCKYGDKCQFAHGAHELRSLARHPKYKTELCRTFHTTGFCPYGPRCHFIHNEDERRLNQINQLKQQQAAVQQVPPGLTNNTGNSSSTSSVSQPQPTPVQRPRALNFSLSLPIVRDSLGSTADSPPSSVTDSPTMSPTFLTDDFLGYSSGSSSSSSSSLPVTFSPSSLPPQSAPPAVTSAFTFHELPPVPSMTSPAATPFMAPLNVQTSVADVVASLAAGLKAASINHHNNNYQHQQQQQQQQQDSGVFRESPSDMFWNPPPSPPDSINGDSIIVSSSNPSTCGSPLDVSRGLRLPIFHKLSDM